MTIVFNLYQSDKTEKLQLNKKNIFDKLFSCLQSLTVN